MGEGGVVDAFGCNVFDGFLSSGMYSRRIALELRVCARGSLR